MSSPLVAIPVAGRVESLNASVAAGVLLYEAVRQRSEAGEPQAATASVVLDPEEGPSYT